MFIFEFSLDICNCNYFDREMAAMQQYPVNTIFDYGTSVCLSV